jgi:hypothetical protein
MRPFADKIPEPAIKLRLCKPRDAGKPEDMLSLSRPGYLLGCF